MNGLPDITANKHRGNENSIAANARAQPSKEKDRARIMAYRDFMGNYGITLKEVSRELNIPIQTASARLSELKAEKELEPRADKAKREHCAVLVKPKKGGQLSLGL